MSGSSSNKTCDQSDSEMKDAFFEMPIWHFKISNGVPPRDFRTVYLLLSVSEKNPSSINSSQFKSKLNTSVITIVGSARMLLEF